MLLLMLFLPLNVFSGGPFQDENVIIDLDSVSIHRVIGDNMFTFINFYSDKCERCSTMAPAYGLAASLLKETRSDIFIGSLNCLKNMQAARDFNVGGLPTIRFFVAQKSYEFQGIPEALSLAHWVTSITGDDPFVIKKSELLRQIPLVDLFSVFGFFKDIEGEECHLFRDVMRGSKYTSWAIVTEADLFEEYAVKSDSHIILLRQFDEPRVDFQGNFTYQGIEIFVKSYSAPYLTEFSDRQSKIPPPFNPTVSNYLVGLLDSSQKKFTLHKMVLLKAAKMFLGQMKVIYAKVQDQRSHYLLSMVRADQKDAPTYLFLKVLPDYRTILYRPKSKKMNSRRVADFVRNVLKGTHDPSYRTEKLKQQWDKYPVKMLVGSNYDEVTRDRQRAVFVQICSERCSQCAKMKKVWHGLAAIYGDRSDLWLAEIDGDKNDLRDFRVMNFPLFYYYPIGEEAGFQYDGERTLEAMRHFLDGGGRDRPRANHRLGEDQEPLRTPGHVQARPMSAGLGEDAHLLEEEM